MELVDVIADTPLASREGKLPDRWLPLPPYRLSSQRQLQKQQHAGSYSESHPPTECIRHHGVVVRILAIELLEVAKQRRLVFELCCRPSRSGDFATGLRSA